MSSFSKMIDLARHLKEIVGPVDASSLPLNPLPSVPSHLLAIHLPAPRDIQGPLLKLGVAAPLASLLSTSFVDCASKYGLQVSRSYEQLVLVLQRSSEELGRSLTPEERSASFSRQLSDMASTLHARYEDHLESLEQKVLQQVASRRRHFNQVQKRQQQYRHSTRKGFAKKSVEVLRKIYLVESYPNIAELRVIAEHIGMDYKQTRVWFQNRRNRKKRSKRGIHEDNRIAKLSGLPPPNPSRITKRTIQQRKENAILRASSSPQLVKKLPVKLAALNLKKAGGAKSSASSAAATRRRLELQEQREREDREMEMQQQMGLVSMEPVDDDEDMETGSGGGAEARQGMEGYQSFSFTYNVQPPFSLSPNPRSSHPSSQHSYSSHSQPQRHYSNEQQPSYSSSSSYHPSSNNSPTYPPYSSSSSSQDYYASQQPPHHSSHHPHHPQSHHQYSHPSSSSQHSLPLQPPPLHPSSYPPAPVELLKNLWDIASVDPLSSYETFARAPAVPSEGLSFITPVPSDHLHHHSSSHNQTLLIEPPWYAVLPAMDSSSPVVATGGEQAQQQGGWGELIDETRRDGGVEEVGAYDYSHLLMGEDLGVAPAGAINGYLPVNNGGGMGESTFMVDLMFEQFEEGGMLSFVVPEAASSW